MPASAKPDPHTIENRGEPTLADVGIRLGEDNEALRNLLIDTNRRIAAIDEVKSTFRNLADPISTMLRALEQEKIDNAGLRNALAELRTSYDTLHSKFSTLENQARELESDREGLRRELVRMQQAARGLENDKTELTSEIVTARSRLEQMGISLAAAEAERTALSAARDKAISEAYALNLRLEAIRSRAATAEKLLSDGRQSLVARADEIKILERKVVEATIARSATEKVVERLTAARDALDGKTRELEQGRASLIERSNSLAETLKARDAALGHAEQKIKSLTDRIAEIEVDAGAYRAQAERRIEELNKSLQRERAGFAAARDALDGKTRDLEQRRTSLIERCNGLAETLEARESALAHAEQKIKSLSDRIAGIEVDAGAYRAQAERHIEELNESLGRERAEFGVARDALDSKTRGLEQGRASLIERSNGLAETLEARESALAHAEQKIKSLSDRIAEIEVDAGAYRTQAERRIEELNESLHRERVALATSRDASAGKTGKLEQGRASLIEWSNGLAEALKARETALADAEQKIKALTAHIAEIEVAARAYRAQAERHIEELNQSLQHERVEFAVARETTRRDHAVLQRDRLTGQAAQQNSVSLDEVSDSAKPKEPSKSNNGRGAGHGARAAEPARATEETRKARGPVEPFQPADLASPLAPAEHPKLREPLASEAATPVAVRPVTIGPSATRVVPSPSDTIKRVPTVDPTDPGTWRIKATDQPTKHAAQIAVFVSRKERKILVQRGFVPLFDMSVVIEEPDRPLGTHVFTAMGLTDNGAGIRWSLTTVPTDPSAPIEHKDTLKKSKQQAAVRLKPPSTAGEALNRIQLPKEAADRLSELLIPGSSLVISDEALGQITRALRA